jgi:hypothetical protein
MVSKKTVVILVIIALVLAIFSFTYSSISTPNKVTLSSEKTLKSDSGKVGVEILPPIVEDKGINNP